MLFPINGKNFTTKCFSKFCTCSAFTHTEADTNKMQLLIKAMKCQGEKLRKSGLACFLVLLFLSEGCHRARENGNKSSVAQRPVAIDLLSC